jgi:hypothetical protein
LPEKWLNIFKKPVFFFASSFFDGKFQRKKKSFSSTFGKKMATFALYFEPKNRI